MDNSATSPQANTLLPTRTDLQTSDYSNGTSDPTQTSSSTFSPQTNGVALSNSSPFNTTGTAPLKVTGAADTTQSITVPARKATAAVVTIKKSVNWPLFGASILLVVVAVYVLMRTGNKQHKKALLKR